MMKLAFLILITLLALVMPLLWITGTLTSIIYFFRHRAGAISEERTIAMNPQLGLTMADGGDPVEELKKGPAEVEQADVPSGSPEPVPVRPVTGKMFWWGGY